MKHFYFIIVFLFTFTQISFSGIDHYVVATENPDDVGGSGTHDDPWLNIHKTYWDSVSSGETVAFKGRFFFNRLPLDGTKTLLPIPKSMTITKWDFQDKPIFDGLTSDGDTLLYAIRVDNKDNVIIKDIDFQNCVRNYIKIYGNGHICDNIVVDGCKFDKIYGVRDSLTSCAAIILQSSSNCTVKNCDILYTYSNFPIESQTDGIFSQYNNNNEYINNFIHINNGVDNTGYHIDCIQSNLDTGITIRGNYLWNESATPSGATVEDRQGIYINSTLGADIINNNIKLNHGSNSIAIDVECDGEFNILHNTLVHNSDSDQLIYLNELTTCSHPLYTFNIYNNILYKEGSLSARYFVQLRHVNYSSISFNQNDYWNSNANGNVAFETYDNFGHHTPNWESWRTDYGYDLNGHKSDPDFLVVDQYKYLLQSTSGSCLDSANTNHTVSDDITGYPRYYGDGPDLGCYEYRPVSIVNSIPSGWQMLSVPVSLEDYTKTNVWPTANSSAFAYCSGYNVKNTLKIGEGYFISFPSAQNLTYWGGIQTEYTDTVCSGWNIVGSLSGDIIVPDNLTLSPGNNTFNAPFYTYINGGYQSIDRITPGLGMWCSVSMAGTLTASCSYFSKTLNKISTEGMDHFIVRDSEGKTQNLYVANIELNPSITDVDFSMPPAFTEAGFDARFDANDYVKKVNPDSGVVELTMNIAALSYPITVSWELNPANGIQYNFNSGLGKGQSKLTRLGSISLMDNFNGKLKMNALPLLQKECAPKEYYLGQNYPNPFNPSTTIKYSVVKDGTVNISVFDILGKEVTKILNEFKSAGTYEINWNASDLSSGIYFYRIKSGSFTDIKKMILLK